MKTIAIEISVEHIPDEMVPPDEPGPKVEEFRLSITQDVQDVLPVGEFVDALAAELLRRFHNLNARKTN